MRSIPNAIPPCGGAPIASASSRKPNFSRCCSGVRSSSANTRACRSASWIRNDPPPSSLPFADQVVGVRDRVRGILVEAVDPVGGRPREGMVLGAVALLVLVPLEHREVGHPEPRLLRLVDQAQAVRELEPQRAEHARGLLVAVRGEEHRRAGLAREQRRARPRRGTSRSASAPPRPRRRRCRRAPSRPTASRTPRARRACCARAPTARAGTEPPRRRRRRRTPTRASPRSRPRSRARSACPACRCRSGGRPRRR